MGEEATKPKRVVDPDSAKFKLGQIAAKAYSDAMEAKERGELVGWCSSNFPVDSGNFGTVRGVPGEPGGRYRSQRRRREDVQRGGRRGIFQRYLCLRPD